MSYLDVPRLHFSGRFVSDPSTCNNTLGSCCDPTSGTPPSGCSHNNAVKIDGDPTLEGWNKDGKHWFQLRDCVVRTIVDKTGAVVSTAAGDKLIGGKVQSTDTPRAARLVDLDPSHQTSSQIWGLGIRLAGTGESLTGQMTTGTLRELWMARSPGGMAGAGGVYQSVLTGLTFNPVTGPYSSVFLSDIAGSGAGRLSIKMVLYAYEPNSASADFTVGFVVGTIGPATTSEPDHFIPDRRVVHAGSSSPAFGVAPFNSAAFNSAPFKIDSARKRLVIDLGNALPESAPAGARRATIGTLSAEIVHKSPKAAETIGTIAYDTAHFRDTAGVEELALTAKQMADLSILPLRLKGGAAAVLAERTAGIHVDVTEAVVRLNPGETKDVDLVVTQFGRPMPSAEVFVGPSRGSALTAISVRPGPAFTTALTPLPGKVKTDATGRVTLRLVAGDPLHPRLHIDGQLAFLGFFLFSATTANQRGEIAIRVFDSHAMPATPKWADVEPILTQYFRLYPSMRFIDLSDHTTVKAGRGAIEAALKRSETDPGYMPVTRDLSRDKKALILKWLADGAP